MEISKATIKDLRCIAEIKSAALPRPQRCCCFRASPATQAEDEFRAYSRYPRQKLEACGTARLDGSILGLCQLQFVQMMGDLTLPYIARHTCKPHECYVEVLAVRGDARGQGIGGKLLRWAEDEAMRRSCKRMVLEVDPTNRAKSLYERHGYKVRESGVYPLKMTKCLDVAAIESSSNNIEELAVQQQESMLEV